MTDVYQKVRERERERGQLLKKRRLALNKI
jgi:hypothetical protein